MADLLKRHPDSAPNKQLTVAYWQKVFGSSFQA